MSVRENMVYLNLFFNMKEVLVQRDQPNIRKATQQTRLVQVPLNVLT